MKGLACKLQVFRYVDGNKTSNGKYKMKTCIITACTGNYKAHLRSIDHLNVDGFIFGDIKDENLQIDGTRWTRIKETYFWHTDPFMTAKYYKCFWHHIPILNEYDVVVWIDGTVEIKSLPLNELKDHDLVVYQHGIRFSTYQEIDFSTDVRYKDYQHGLKEQKQLKNIDWLAITCFVVNKRCESVIKMNNKWFSDIILYSPQDQVSFPSACEYVDVNVKLYKFSKPYRGNVRIRDWRRTAWKSHTETEHYIKHNHLISHELY
jgi:hypothetical protein